AALPRSLHDALPIYVRPIGAWSSDELLRLAASLDRRSGHPLAEAVVQAARHRNLDLSEPADFDSVAGRGVAGTIDEHELLVGNEIGSDTSELQSPDH